MTHELSTLYFGRMKHACQRVERLFVLPKYRVDNTCVTEMSFLPRGCFL